MKIFKTCLITLILDQCIDMFFTGIYSNFSVYRGFAVGEIVDIYVKGAERTFENCRVTYSTDDLVILQYPLPSGGTFDFHIKNGKLYV